MIPLFCLLSILKSQKIRFEIFNQRPEISSIPGLKTELHVSAIYLEPEKQY